MSQSGLEGCVIIPSLKNDNNSGYVTKLFYTKSSKDKEIQALELFKSSHLDDSQEYTITEYDETPITIPTDISKKCNGKVSNLFVNYRYGGVPIQSIQDNPVNVVILKSVINSLIPISKFIQSINSRGYYHNDLHSGNIVYNDTTKKSYIIDFGTFVKESNTALLNDFSSGANTGIFKIIYNLVNILLSKFGEDEINISQDEHSRYTKFLMTNVGNDRMKMLDAILMLSNTGGKRRKITRRSRRKTRKLSRK